MSYSDPLCFFTRGTAGEGKAEVVGRATKLGNIPPPPSIEGYLQGADAIPTPEDWQRLQQS